MEKIKVMGLFRIPVSYFNALLVQFSRLPEIDLKIAFSIKPQNTDIFPTSDLDYVFLDGAEEAFCNNEHSERDHLLKQKSIEKEILQFRPDIFFINTGYLMPTTWIAISICKKMRIPIVTRMTTEGVLPRNIFKRIAKKIIVGLYCKNMDAGVYECKLQKDYMISYGMNPHKLFFAPCAVDNEYFSSLNSKYTKSEAKAALKINQDCIVIADTAELIQRKRPMDLIKAVENLRNEYNIMCFFIGKGALFDELSNYIESHNLKECVLCGRLKHEEMSKYLCAADIFVMPSQYDASPKALNEAMNFNVAIVVTDGVCTAPELCKEGENGYVYKAGNIDELTNKIRCLLDRRDELDSMGCLSKNIVSEFSYESVLNGWKKAIDYCLKNKS